MTSGGNYFNYIPDNPITKFSAVKKHTYVLSERTWRAGPLLLVYATVVATRLNPIYVNRLLIK